jgi:hypothetical protein
MTNWFELQTFQEFLVIGPYVPCGGTGDYREPEFVYRDRALDYEAVLATALTTNPLRITMNGGTQDTANAGPEHGYGHNEEIIVNLGLRVWTEEPDHQQGWFDDRYGTIHPAYPVDELAGIVLHEMLHTVGFEHGEASSNQCGYDAYECPPNKSSDLPTCRNNSLHEVAEAVMSEILEVSIGWCGATGGVLPPPPSDDPGYLPVACWMVNDSSTIDYCHNESYW